MHVFDCVYVCEFQKEILFRGESVKPEKILNLNFSKKKNGGKTVIYRNSPKKS